MEKSIFPPLDTADDEGLIAIGGDLTINTLVDAYIHGIFPWPISEEYPLAWFSPDPRGILLFDNLHIPKSLEKALKKTPFEFKMNTDFEQVIYSCSKASNRKEEGTWITDEIINAYIDLHKEGLAYSAETYLDGKLVGGVYGVCINDYFTGESMFYNEDNASKFALINLMQFLDSIKIPWLDTQMVTPVVESLGGITVPRESFVSLLERALLGDPD